MMKNEALAETKASFMKFNWHDSRLINIHTLRMPDIGKYEVRIDVDLIVGFADNDYQRVQHQFIFHDCEFVGSNINLPFLASCNGDISRSLCFSDLSELDPPTIKKLRAKFSLDNSSSESCNLGFYIELLIPGGEILIIGKNFETEPV